MLLTAALPFVLRREHGIINGSEITSTREHLHGLVYLNGEQLVIQWRTSREISRVGREIRTDREVTTVREVTLPLSALAGASVRRVWQRWWFGEVFVLTAADLKAFDALTEEGDLPGLMLEHPAEIVLEVRRTDRDQLREFVSKLRLAISENRLAAFEELRHEHGLSGREMPPLSEGKGGDGSLVRARGE
jgi:hypothetical protein